MTSWHNTDIHTNTVRTNFNHFSTLLQNLVLLWLILFEKYFFKHSNPVSSVVSEIKSGVRGSYAAEKVGTLKVNQTSSSAVSSATLGRWLRDGVKCIWVFLMAEMASSMETQWFKREYMATIWDKTAERAGWIFSEKCAAHKQVCSCISKLYVGRSRVITRQCKDLQ